MIGQRRVGRKDDVRRTSTCLPLVAGCSDTLYVKRAGGSPNGRRKGKQTLRQNLKRRLPVNKITKVWHKVRDSKQDGIYALKFAVVQMGGGAGPEDKRNYRKKEGCMMEDRIARSRMRKHQPCAEFL